MSVVLSQAYVGGIVNNAAITTNQIFPNPASLVTQPASQAAVLAVPGSGRLNGKYFEVWVSGIIVAAASMNVTPILYSGTSLTPGSNTIIATGTAFATGAAITTNFWCKYFLEGDSTSGFLQGTQSQQVNNVLVAPTATGVTKLTAQNFTTIDPALNLVFGLTFSVAGANSATLTQFLLEA
jgi:hypothetical protein